MQFIKSLFKLLFFYLIIINTVLSLSPKSTSFGNNVYSEFFRDLYNCNNYLDSSLPYKKLANIIANALRSDSNDLILQILVDNDNSLPHIRFTVDEFMTQQSFSPCITRLLFGDTFNHHQQYLGMTNTDIAKILDLLPVEIGYGLFRVFYHSQHYSQRIAIIMNSNNNLLIKYRGYEKTHPHITRLFAENFRANSVMGPFGNPDLICESEFSCIFFNDQGLPEQDVSLFNLVDTKIKQNIAHEVKQHGHRAQLDNIRSMVFNSKNIGLKLVIQKPSFNILCNPSFISLVLEEGFKLLSVNPTICNVYIFYDPEKKSIMVKFSGPTYDITDSIEFWPLAKNVKIPGTFDEIILTESEICNELFMESIRQKILQDWIIDKNNIIQEVSA